ncbi:MAG TPA: class I SAM-dependent methyltransferase [Thermoanaerobaculia bacterium]|nr:class I SAM-dependent methyltransferase [Thermoanaerobaculia bacterium]
MLADANFVRALVVCPRCRGALEGSWDALRCANDACALDAFHTVGRWPVLVDFDDSILDEQRILASGAATLAPRVGGVLRRLRDFLTSRPDTPDYVRRFRDAVPRGGTVLIIGGGTVGALVQPFYDDPELRVIGFDIYGTAATQFVADAHQIPAADASVDAVVIIAVLEHVLDPWRVVGEIHRVLKPGGALYAETPFLQHVHEAAYDFTRFTESGHRWLFRRFDRVASGTAGGPGTQLLWSVQHFVRSLTRSRMVAKAAGVLFHWLRWFDGAIAERDAIDGASAFYFVGTKSDRVLAPREMAAYYRGAQR